MKGIIDYLCRLWYMITSIPADKLLHCIACLYITLCAGIIKPIAPFAIVVALVCGMAKEIIDVIRAKSFNAFDKWDVLADCFGALTAQMLIWCYLAIF